MPWTKQKHGRRILKRGKFFLTVSPLPTTIRWDVIARGKGLAATGSREDSNLAQAKRDCYEKYEQLRKSG